jgi:hypothetical protein
MAAGQLVSLALWYSIASVISMDEWLIYISFGCLGIYLGGMWFLKMRDMNPFSWTVAFLWFPSCAAIAIWYAWHKPLAHPIALCYATTSVICWSLMWSKGIKQCIRGYATRTETDT